MPGLTVIDMVPVKRNAAHLLANRNALLGNYWVGLLNLFLEAEMRRR